MFFCWEGLIKRLQEVESEQACVAWSGEIVQPTSLTDHIRYFYNWTAISDSRDLTQRTATIRLDKNGWTWKFLPQLYYFPPLSHQSWFKGRSGSIFLIVSYAEYSAAVIKTFTVAYYLWFCNFNSVWKNLTTNHLSEFKKKGSQCWDFISCFIELFNVWLILVFLHVRAFLFLKVVIQFIHNQTE